MICQLFKAIEMTELIEHVAKSSHLPSPASNGIRLQSFCRDYTARFRRMAESDPKHIDLYRYAAQFLVDLHNRGPLHQFFLNPIYRNFKEDCRSLGIECGEG